MGEFGEAVDVEMVGKVIVKDRGMDYRRTCVRGNFRNIEVGDAQDMNNGTNGYYLREDAVEDAGMLGCLDSGGLLVVGLCI